jgi:RNA polymerase sigma factor (sigma-70 family)
MSKPNIEDIIMDFITHADMYHTYVHECCRAMGLKGHEIDDVAGNALAKAYQGLPQYRGQASLKTWLWRITHNEMVTYFRQKRRHLKWHQYNRQSPETPADLNPCHLSMHKEAIHRLHLAIRRLPPAWKRAVHLFYWQQQSTPTIAQTMQCSPQLVRTYLFRARQQLKGALVS